MSNQSAHRVSHSDDIRAGAAEPANRTLRGVPIAGKAVDRYSAAGPIVFPLGAPAAAATNNIAAAQAIAGAGNALINGALAASGVATVDVPRGVQVVSSNAGDTTQTATFSGADEYGAPLKEVLSLNGTTPVLGKKAFKTVTQIAISAALAGNFSSGTTSKLGLPYRPTLGGFIRGRLGEDTADAGTYVAPERAASTGTTNDVRGTYAPAGTLNGTNVYTVQVAVDNGPSQADAFGIAQFNG